MSSHDVRMRGFASRTDLDEALSRLRALVRRLGAEEVALDEALGRTLAADVVAARDVPAFRKSAVDGYAVRAAETFGASGQDPLVLSLVGEVLPGVVGERRVGPGEAVRIMTGGAVPEGADAVAMAEVAAERGGELLLSDAVTPGRNVAAVGEDIRRGEMVLRAGRVLKPQDLGVIASLARPRVAVVQRPRIAVLTTGNELVSADDPEADRPGRVINSNRYTLKGLVAELGCLPLSLGIAGDDEQVLGEAVKSFPGDILVTTGATSVGKEDFLPLVVRALGELVVHGMNIKPGSPAGFGVVGERLVFLLPGNPVAAMVAFDVLVRPVLQLMLGQEEGRRNPRLRARLRRKMASALNRVEFVRVCLVDGEVEPLRAGGSGVLSSMSKADGFVIVPRDVEGHEAGELVEVYLL